MICFFPGVQCNKECVSNKDKSNSGQMCPWTGSSFGVKCNPQTPGATNAGGNKIIGTTSCALGKCPSGSVGLFCILQGSGNFKLC